MCQILSTTQQDYDEWVKRKPSQTKLRHHYLEKAMKRVYEENKGRYGSPRIALQLYEEGIKTKQRVVAAMMRKIGFCAKGYHSRIPFYGQPKAIETAIKENLLNSQFS